MAGYPRMMSAIVSIHKTDDAIIAAIEDTMQDNAQDDLALTFMSPDLSNFLQCYLKF